LLTLSPLSRISSALAPLTVQCTAIFSFLLMPKDLTVYLFKSFMSALVAVNHPHLALLKTGCCPVRDSSTLAALVSLSPDSPTQMLRQSLRIRTSRIGFFAFSVGILKRGKVSNDIGHGV